MAPNILITTSSFGKNDPEPLEKLRRAGFDVMTNPFGRKLTENEVSELISSCKPIGIIAGVEPLTEAVLKKATGLKAISRCGIGMDSVDLVTAKKMQITVCNTPDAPTISVAELTLGMILSLLRKMHVADSSIRAGKWNRPMGNLLYEKKVGIVGCGRIGSYLAKLLVPFHCIIWGYDIVPKEDNLIKFVALNELLGNSDIVSLHLPYGEDTHHFMNRERIGMMRKGAFLINAGRGGLVDETELMGALSSGYLSGAALDCFETEPYCGPLGTVENVLLTSHIGSYAIEGRVRMEMEAVSNLIQGLKRVGET